MILITQLGKVGLLVQATMPETIPLPTISSLSDEQAEAPLPEPPSAILLTPLMGTSLDARHQILTNLYVSQIATLAWYADTSQRLPIVVGLALKKEESRREEDDLTMDQHDRETFLQIMNVVGEGLKQIYSRPSV